MLTGQAPPGVWDALVDIAAAHGYRVERGDCGGPNGFIRWADRLIKVRDDVEDVQATKTLMHELGHMLLHNITDFTSGDTRRCRGEKEVEAESTAFLTAAHVGLDTSDYTFGYVTGWAEKAVTETGKAPHEIVQATGTRVVRAAAQLTTALDEALGHGEEPVSAQLAQRVQDGVQATAEVRASAQAAASQAALFDRSSAGRAFPASPGGSAATSQAPPPVPPALATGRARHR